MIGIFYDDGSGTIRMTGYAQNGYETTDDNETLKDTTEDDLSSIFEAAKSDGETLDGADKSIDAAIDDPLAFSDFLILDSNDTIAFDTDYVRDSTTETSS